MPDRTPTLRPAGPKDESFLLRLYGSTRNEELALTNWSARERDAFLRSQFELRTRSYRQHYPRADNCVIVLHGVSIGSLIVDRGPDALTLVNIALLPEYRGTGIGSGLLQELLADAARTFRPLRLSVLKSNRARKLYERLGFGPTGSDGEYLSMEWRPVGWDQTMR